MIPLVFCGTPEFACPTLRAFIESDRVEIKGILTQPDRPRGRGLRLAAPPVKKLAAQYDLSVFQPESLDEESLSWLRRASPEMIVVVAYAAKIPNEMLELPPKGVLNLHPSLLPRYRGAAPIQWALMRGETETGNTTMYLSEEWDAGDIIYQEKEPIHPEDNYGTLSARLAEKGAHLMLKTVIDVSAGTAPRIPQDESRVTWARLIKPKHETIDWTRSAGEIHNQVRGLSPAPGARTTYEGKVFKILRTEVPSIPSEGAPGTVADTSFGTVRVNTGEGILELLEIQPAGKKPMPIAAYLRGHSVEPGSQFE